MVYCHLVANGKTLGQHLREAREGFGFSLEYVGKLSGVPVEYLSALEDGAYEKLSAAVYGKNFVKAFARAVGLDPKKISDIFKRETEAFFSYQQTLPKFAKKTREHRFITFHPKLFRICAASLLALMLFAFLSFRLFNMLSRPELLLTSPASDLVLNGSAVEVNGKVSQDSTLTINGEEIFSRENGYFNEVLHLQEGINVITVRAKKKFGRAHEISRRVVVRSS